MSWIPWQKARLECQDLDCLTIKAIIVGCTTETPLIEAYVGKMVISPENNTLFYSEVGTDQNPPITNQEWREQQNQDKTIVEIKNLLQSKKLSQLKGHKSDLEEMKTMLRHKHQFILRSGLLHRKIQFHSDDQPSLQFVLPQSYRWQAMKACHDDIGNLGLERSLYFLRDRFYWAGMMADTENHIWTCDKCLCFKSKPQGTELYPITATHPLELFYMDFLTIESGKTVKGVNILVVTDHCTQYAQAFVTTSYAAWVVAESL